MSRPPPGYSSRPSFPQLSHSQRPSFLSQQLQQPQQHSQIHHQSQYNPPIGQQPPSSGGRASEWDLDEEEEQELGRFFEPDEGRSGGRSEYTGGSGGYQGDPPSPSPSRSFGTSSQSRQTFSQPPSNLASYYAPPPPPPSSAPPSQQPSVTQPARSSLARQFPQPSQPAHSTQQGGGVIRPMPLRPPPSHHAPSSSQTRNFVRPSTTYAAPLPPPHQQHQQFEQTAHGRHARLSALEEDEEDYWGGQEEEGLEQALVGLEAGVVSGGGDFRGGAGRQPAPQAFQRNPKPSQTQPPQHYFPSRDTQHYQQQQQPQQQQEPQVAYLEDLDPFASTRPGFVRPQAQSYSASRGGGGMQTNATGGNRGMEGGGEVGGGGGAKKGIKLRPVSELPDMFRSLWRFGVFNAVQSSCFDTVYHSDNNVVVSAPTGAGKTVLFELAIIRLFTTSTDSDTKVLYMAPTKSLCSERSADWKKKFEQGLGWSVLELTGDSGDLSTSTWRDVAKARIVITTPEKWDSLTRKWHDHGGTLGMLRLFCVDEVHTVGADVRGAVLEVVVSRMKTLGTSTRFIAVSATVPNIEDVAEWLGSGGGSTGEEKKSAEVFRFGEEFRPCKLQKFVYGYPKKDNDFAFVNTLNFKLYDLIKQHSSGKPVLVFVSTRKACTEAANALVNDYKKAASSSLSAFGAGGVRNLAWPRPPRSSYKASDKHLGVLLESGVATHHAGMDFNDRKLVEKLFVEGGVSVVCATSTLAVGVNLPARMVIIRGTKGFWDGESREYSALDVTQMLGRAGRPQFDTMGVACIMTDKESQPKYEGLVNSQVKLESFLHKSLTEHVNSEITLRTITDVPTALRWLRSTFLFVRITKNAPYYSIANGASNPDERLEEICVQAIKELVASGVVDQDGEELLPNQFGDIMSKFYISHTSFNAIKSLPKKSSMRKLLETLSASTELSSFRWRQGEKTVLAKYNKNVKFPTEKVATVADRSMILIQLILEGITGAELKTDNINPMLDARQIIQAAIRVAKAMVEVAVEREDGAVRTAMELLRSLNGRCWDSSSFVLRQLEGIGEKGFKALVESGIRSFDDVREAEPERLEIILSRKPPFGRKMQQQAKSLPQFELTIVSNDETVVSEGIQVELAVELSLKETKPPAIVKKGSMKLWASLASVTSDGEFIDFRRVRLDNLLGNPKQFSFSTLLVKPSQRILVTVSCEALAGTEVKAQYRPETKSSSFPIPSMGPSNSDEEVDVEELQKSRPSKQKPAPFRKSTLDASIAGLKKSVKAAGDGNDDDDDPYVEPSRRADGKYNCNHNCHDKTSCKHLCCREGLDRPPRRRAKASTAPKASTKSKTMPTLTQAFSAVDTETNAKPLRLPGKASAGVTLSRLSGGRTKAKPKEDDADSDLDDDLLSLDELVSTSKPRSSTRRVVSASNRLSSPPPAKKSYLDREKSDPQKDVDVDELMSSPSPPPAAPVRPLKRAPRPDTSEGSSSGKKRRRFSLREFAASSDLDLDLDEPVKTMTAEDEPAPPTSSPVFGVNTFKGDPLFRLSPRLSTPPPRRALSPPIATSIASDPLEWPAPYQQPPIASGTRSNEEFEMDELEGDPQVGGADMEGEGKKVEEEELGDDDDEFDAWLERSVVVV